MLTKPFLISLCLSFDNMFKTEFIKLLQVINTCYLDTCVTMLYSATKVQVRDFKYIPRCK